MPACIRSKKAQKVIEKILGKNPKEKKSDKKKVDLFTPSR